MPLLRLDRLVTGGTYLVAGVIVAYALSHTAPAPQAPVIAGVPPAHAVSLPPGRVDAGLEVTVNGSRSIGVAQGEAATVSGTANDAATHAAASRAIAQVDGALFDAPVDLLGRFSLTLPTTNLGVGPHVVWLLFTRADERTYGVAKSAIALDVMPPQARDPHVVGVVDGVNGVALGSRHSVDVDGLASITVTGWIADRGRERVVDAVELTLDGRPVARVACCNPRPDVAAVLGDPVAAWSGYAAEVPLDGVPPGEHAVALHAVEAGVVVPGDVAAFKIAR